MVTGQHPSPNTDHNQSPNTGHVHPVKTKSDCSRQQSVSIKYLLFI